MIYHPASADADLCSDLFIRVPHVKMSDTIFSPAFFQKDDRSGVEERQRVKENERRRTDRQADRQTNKAIDRQAGRQTG